jgi:hypothetical protein
MKHSLFIPFIVFCLSFEGCQHKSNTSVKPTTTTTNAPRVNSYIITDTAYKKNSLTPDSLLYSFHGSLHDTEKILFDTGGKYILFRNDTVKYWSSALGDTTYLRVNDNSYPDLITITFDSFFLSNTSYFGHLYSMTASISGYKIH